MSFQKILIRVALKNEDEGIAVGKYLRSLLFTDLRTTLGLSEYFFFLFFFLIFCASFC